MTKTRKTPGDAPTWSWADVWTPTSCTYGRTPEEWPLTPRMETLRAELARGYRLSAHPGDYDWRLHAPNAPDAPAGGTLVHFSLGRGLLLRGLLEVEQDANGRRLYRLKATTTTTDESSCQARQHRRAA